MPPKRRIFIPTQFGRTGTSTMQQQEYRRIFWNFTRGLSPDIQELLWRAWLESHNRIYFPLYVHRYHRERKRKR
jgi:hypothetical protein